MPKQRKIDQVAELQDKLGRCSVAIATDPTGLTVNALNDLRRNLRQKNIEYRVVKNSLTYLAADGAEVPHLKGVVQGPTALAFGYGDPAEVASALEGYIRSTRSVLAIRGGILGTRVMTPSDVTSLTTLPSREVMVARVLGQLQAPVVGLLGQLQAPMQRLLGALQHEMSQFLLLLQQRVEQMKAQEGAK